MPNSVSTNNLSVLCGGYGGFIVYFPARENNQFYMADKGKLTPQTPITPTSMTEQSEPSPFQLLFFDQLARLTGRRHAAFLEQARKAGIPRECAEAYWRTR